MLIKGLCDYYDILKERGDVLPEGYSPVSIKYKISLTDEGNIDEIVSCQEEVENGGKKPKLIPKDVIMPKRTEKPGIDANVIEHRPLYIFGLNYNDGRFDPDDKTNKARKSHADFVAKNLEFIEGLDSPVINAYRKFLQNWAPEHELNNQCLFDLGKNYANSGYAFFLSGEPEKLLHDDPQIKTKWNEEFTKRNGTEEGAHIAQCAISGETAPIARIHSKIKGVAGGLATGSVLIGFNNSSENSYGNEQSFNSNVSEEVMTKYTEALNYLLKDRKHKIVLDDMTVVFWAMSKNEGYEGNIMDMLMGNQNEDSGTDTEEMIRDILKRGSALAITENELNTKFVGLDPDTDFYIVGLKPNSSNTRSRVILRKRYGDILLNVARFQGDAQITEPLKLLPLYRIKKELVSPNSSSEKVNPALLSKLFEAIMYDSRFPASLLETLVRRVKTDKNVNEARAGLIKAYLNRNEKEEIKLALDYENKNQAYLCGRLFAALERLQKNALGDINATIKDKYFSSAAAKPATVFPTLLTLAQAHLKKLDGEGSKVFYNKLIGQIIDNLEDEFPPTLPLADQGKFIIGYYQQTQEFFRKKEDREEQ